GRELRLQLDPAPLLPPGRAALKRLAPASPQPLRACFEELLGDPGRLAAALETYVREGGRGESAQEPREQLAARIVVSPYAELLSRGDSGPAGGQRCPRCAGLPVAGVLRPAGDGGKRSLLCAFCGSEWEFRRVCCAYCGESEEKALAVFV